MYGGSERAVGVVASAYTISLKIVGTVWTVRTTHAGLGFALSQGLSVLGTVRTTTLNRPPPTAVP